MKKLALALVCFASVAFFASCTKPVENPEPSIAVITGENYVYDGQTIDIDNDYLMGFRAASNSQTMKELAKFNLSATLMQVDGTEIYTEDTTFNISGTEYLFTDTLNFTLTSRELVGKVSFTATVTDVDGKMNSTTINLNINQPAVELEPKDFSWLRKGSAPGTGVEEYGIEWTSNVKLVNAVLKPVAGAKMYILTREDWDAITTDVEKAAFFSDGANEISDFRGVSANQSDDYDYVIATLYNGEYHLIHITHADVQAIYNEGTYVRTDITITGQSK